MALVPRSSAYRAPRVGYSSTPQSLYENPNHPYNNGNSVNAPQRPLGGLTFDGTGLLGTGLFSSGLDFTQWTWAEWLTVGLVGFAAYRVFAGGSASRGFSSGRRRKLEVARAKYQLERAEA